MFRLMSDIDPLASGKCEKVDEAPTETLQSPALYKAPGHRGRPSNRNSTFWEMVTVEYITGTMTVAELGRKYGVLYASMRYHLQEKLEVKARQNDPQAISFLQAVEIKDGTLSEKAREAAGLIVRMHGDAAAAWQKEAVERSYSLREEVDRMLQDRVEKPLTPLELLKAAQAEETIDKVARRSLGLKDGIHVEGSVTHNHRHLIEAAKEVLGSRAAGEAPALDADFELLESSGQ